MQRPAGLLQLLNAFLSKAVIGWDRRHHHGCAHGESRLAAVLSQILESAVLRGSMMHVSRLVLCFCFSSFTALDAAAMILARRRCGRVRHGGRTKDG